jgi:hypothetical protein
MLTEYELSFLSSISLGPDDVFDGRGMPQWRWRQLAKEQGKALALGRPCQNGGHRLRTRGGHCVQCDPKKLAYQDRFTAEQYVYVAGSLSAKLIKIGTCVNRRQRERQLRAEGYGGVGDWQLLYSMKVRNAGEVEHQTRTKLADYFVPPRSYWKDDVEQYAIELLRCSFSRARRALDEVSAQATTAGPWKHILPYTYEFSEDE